MLYPKGIEVVCGIIIRNKQGKILLTRSQNWSDKWVLPGGHIEAGESIFKAAVREGREETGLELKPVAICFSGELINTADFKRPAHFVYFNVVLDALSENMTLDNKEHSDYRWLNPEEALRLDLAESFDLSLKKYIDYIRLAH